MWGLIPLVIAAIMAFIERKELFKKPLTTYKVIIIVLVLGGIVYSFIEYKQNQRESRYSKNSGILYPKNADDKTLYLIGGGGDSMEYAKGVIDFRKDMNDSIEFIAWVENNRLYVNTTIRDTLGNVIAKLDRNEWIVNKNVTLDRNFDNSALEVKDNQGSIVFQIELNGNLIKMKGIFELEDDRTFIISSSVYEQRNVGIWQVGPRKDVHWSAKGLGMLDIKPIFKYPSDLHKGERY